MKNLERYPRKVDNNNNNNNNSKNQNTLLSAATTGGGTKKKNRNKHEFTTKFSLILTACTIGLMLLLSALFSTSTTPPRGRDNGSSLLQQRRDEQLAQQRRAALSFFGDERRWLEEPDDDNDNNRVDDDDDTADDDVIDHSIYSCDYMYEKTPYPGEEQCRFARTCNRGKGIWAPFVFCRYNSRLFSSTVVLCAMMSPFLILWLVLLFRMLGSTAEDYFSPALEMFSFKLALPPRFAGVTLLALGNGAADVSATVAAIQSDPNHGYQIALGALTGAAMFICGLVSAIVVLVAGGVPCRGALVRDVTALLLSCLVVWFQLASKGTVGHDTVSLFLCMYTVFVIVVLVADVYHRAVVVPRLRLLAQAAERRRQLDEAEVAANSSRSIINNNNDGTTTAATTTTTTTTTPANGVLSNVLTALSNYDRPNGQNQQGNGQGDGWGVDSDDLAREQPIFLHGTHGILHGDGAGRPGASNGGHEDPTADANDAAANYSIMEETADRVCLLSEPGSMGSSATSWRGAWQDGKHELLRHFESIWDDIVWNGDVHVVTKFLLLCELPFTALRKCTVPIPCEGYYVRSLVALSMAISPLWVSHYLWDAHGYNLFVHPTIFLPYWALCIAVGVVLLRYAPSGGNLALYISTPVAFYGFVIAATWIDQIANALVSLLQFMGIVLRIPGPIIGMTILAWGNSMGDLSANATMARKGLANMAMTACFAGPVFNILVGLGLGFGALFAQTGEIRPEVSVPPSVGAGFLFLVLNSIVICVAGLVFGQGRIPSKYGYVAFVLYTLYIVVAVALQYSNSN